MSDPSADEQALQAALAYDTAVVPRYARAFGDLLLRAMDVPVRANVLDLACRTGYPAVNLIDIVGDGRIVAIDGDPAYLELARARAGEEVGRRLFLKQESVEALPFGNDVFTNVIGNLIDRATTDRGALLSEAGRVLRPGGQLVLTMPLRGSFGEVLDMLREVALKHDLPGVGERIEQYAVSMPTPETWLTELESRGFEGVLIDHESFVLEFDSGGALLTDPAILAAAAPEWQWCVSTIDEPAAAFYWLQDAIDTYFAGRTFEVTVVAGCASARRSRR